MVAVDGSMVSGVDNGRMDDKVGYPDVEVPVRATRRRFPAEYKARILAEYETLPDGDKGALLRREGLYSSLISEWRKQAARGAVAGLANKRGRPGPDAKEREIAKLRGEIERLRGEVDKRDRVIEVQGKVSALLEELSKSAETDRPSTR
jgi:transposase-like protein